MNNSIKRLVMAQFLSAFADNAVLFATISMAMARVDLPAWYVPALQGSFLVAYVVLAPWVGHAADRFRKPRLLTWANAIKGLGAGLLIFEVEPILAYGLVGAGAALYSPAKYGILPELCDKDHLVKANGWIEGSTIVAIVVGAVLGAFVADRVLMGALIMVVACYALSGLLALTIHSPEKPHAGDEGPIQRFTHMAKTLVATPRARFATLGVTLFWSSSVVLRVALVAWAPLVLAMSKTTEIAELTLFTALGIALGAFLAPKLIQLDRLSRARYAAYAMGLAILLFSTVETVMMARLVLVLIGIAGGLFVVPVNAALQEIGHRSGKSGAAVAVQHFYENSGMLIAMGIFAVTAGQGASPVTSLAVLGGLVLLVTFIVSMHLPARGTTVEPGHD